MQFYKLTDDCPFFINGEEYQKVKEERISCCKIKLNAYKLMEDGEKKPVVIQPKQEVSLP
jgi:hypothetical protein